MSSAVWKRLKGADSQFHPRLVGKLDEFHSKSNCRFVFGGQREIQIEPPVTASDADSRFFESTSRLGANVLKAITQQKGGRVLGPACRISRSNSKFVCLAPGAEGVIFDENGIYKNGGFLKTIRKNPRWLTARPSESSTEYYADFDYLNQLPEEPGAFLMCFDGNVHNYKHWWIDMLCPLDAAVRRCMVLDRRMVHDELQRLVPWQRDSLGVADGGRLWEPESNVDIVRVGEVIWIDIIDSYPFHYDEIDIFSRNITAKFRSDRLGKKRLYLKRLNNLRQMRNELEVEAMLAARGFDTVILETISQKEQIELFMDADVVAGNHGAGFANIVFCPRGATILELMPSVEMRAHYWGIASALGHRHGFLRCNSLAGSNFHAPIEVSIPALEKLISIML